MDLLANNIIDIYSKVVSGSLKRFPPETWNPYKSGYDNYKRCARYLILDMMLFSREDILNIDVQFFRKHKLGGAIDLFNQSPYEALKFAFDELSIKPWEMKVSPQNSWDENSIILAVKWFVEDKMKWDRDDIVRYASKKVFVQHGFQKIFSGFEKSDLCAKLNRDSNGLFELFSLVYPEYNLKIWEFNKSNTWSKEDMRDAFKWMIEERCCWSYEEALDKLYLTHFKENGLFSLLQKYFSTSPYKAMVFTYPDFNWDKLKRNGRRLKVNKT